MKGFFIGLLIALGLTASSSTYAQRMINCEFEYSNSYWSDSETISVSLDLNDWKLNSTSSGTLMVKNWDGKIFVELYDPNPNGAHIESTLRIDHKNLKNIKDGQEFKLTLQTQDQPTATCRITRD